MPSYLVHAMEGRARLRHALFSDAQQRARVLAFLEKEAEVLEVRPGRNSFLLMLADGADISALCSRLEQNMPDLVQEVDFVSKPARHSRFLPAGLGRIIPACSGVSPRKLEVRTMLGAGVLCLALGLFGSKRGHVAAGGLFTLLAVRHIWMRRKAL